jgi:sensor histidine kinase YesM
MLNHLNTILNFIEKGDIEKAKKHIISASNFIARKSQLANTGNVDVDCILNHKLERIQNLGIEYSLNTEIPPELSIDTFDLNVVIGNLLDNAIEGAEKAETKNISISIISRKEVLVIEISNTYNLKKFNNFTSTKANKGFHGWGLKSVKSIVEKYGGDVNIDRKDDIITIKCNLFSI